MKTLLMFFVKTSSGTMYFSTIPADSITELYLCLTYGIEIKYGRRLTFSGNDWNHKLSVETDFIHAYLDDELVSVYWFTIGSYPGDSSVEDALARGNDAPSSPLMSPDLTLGSSIEDLAEGDSHDCENPTCFFNEKPGIIRDMLSLASRVNGESTDLSIDDIETMSFYFVGKDDTHGTIRIANGEGVTGDAEMYLSKTVSAKF